MENESKKIVKIVLPIGGANGKLLYTNINSEIHKYAQSQGWENNFVEYFGPPQDNFSFNELIHAGFTVKIGGVTIRQTKNIATLDECACLHEKIYG